MKEEFALNVRANNGAFVRQIDVFGTLELAKEYADQHPELFSDGFAEIVCIERDADENEINSYAVMRGGEDEYDRYCNFPKWASYSKD